MENEHIEETVNEDKNDICPKKESHAPGILFAISFTLMYGLNIAFDIFYSIKAKTHLLVVVFFRITDTLSAMFASRGYFTDYYEVICLSLSVLTLIGFVLMIVLRVKYPEYQNGKILMWITIAIIVFFVIAINIIIAMCEATCNSCCRPFE